MSTFTTRRSGISVYGAFTLSLRMESEKLTTGFHTFGVAFDLYGHFHHNRLLGVYLKEIDVEHGVP